MEYDVVLAVQAQTDFREIINYLAYELQNQQAAGRKSAQRFEV